MREGCQVRAHETVCRWKVHLLLLSRGSSGVTSVSHRPMRRLQPWSPARVGRQLWQPLQDACSCWGGLTQAAIWPWSPARVGRQLWQPLQDVCSCWGKLNARSNGMIAAWHAWPSSLSPSPDSHCADARPSWFEAAGVLNTCQTSARYAACSRGNSRASAIAFTCQQSVAASVPSNRQAALGAIPAVLQSSSQLCMPQACQHR